MDKSVERAREAELQVQAVIDYIFERGRHGVECIQEEREKENRIGIELGFIYILIKLFYAVSPKFNDPQYAQEMANEANDFWEILRALIVGSKINIWDCIGEANMEPFFHYCYFLKQSIFNCINIGYPGGVSYAEFVDNILKENGISCSEEQRKKLADSFKMYLSKIYNTRGDYIRAILSERMTHESISDKNKGVNSSKWEFGPILLYERTAYEFEFFIRKKNRTKGMEAIMEQLDKIASKRIETISGSSLPKNFQDKQNRYANLVKKPISKMSKEELKEYREYVHLKRGYIRAYARENQKSKKLVYIEEAKFFNDLLFYKVEDQCYQSYIKCSFDVIGRALWVVIQHCGSDERERQDIWDALVDLSFIFGQLMDKYEADQKCYKPIISLWYDSKWLEEYKRIWEYLPVFSVKESEEIIQKVYVKDLQEKDEGLRDYIELCILSSNLIPETGELDELENAFKVIFRFLEQCKNEMKEKRDITIDLEELREKIGYEHERENQYSYKIFRTYFQECVRTRYIRLYKITNKDVSEKREVNTKSIIEKYLDSILFKYADNEKDNGKEKKVPKRYTGELNKFLLSQLIKYLYPNRLSNPNVDDIYIKKDMILCIAKKYGFMEALGFKENI